jgi:hypothetical protein
MPQPNVVSALVADLSRCQRATTRYQRISTFYRIAFNLPDLSEVKRSEYEKRAADAAARMFHYQARCNELEKQIEGVLSLSFPPSLQRMQ